VDSQSAEHPFASRAGVKLAHALDIFRIDPSGLVCADLGCSTGGFTDCLLQRGAAKVFAIDRGFGVLNYRLRKDPRVVTMERTDALQVHLPEPVQLVTIDCGWTRQRLVLPAAKRLLAPGGCIISLLKPHYEAEPAQLRGGVLPDDLADDATRAIRDLLPGIGLSLRGETESPIRGKGGNREFLWWIAQDTRD